MPGLNFVFKEEGINLDYDNIGDILRYDENYFYKTIISSKNIYLSYSGYKEYPLFEFIHFKELSPNLVTRYPIKEKVKNVLRDLKFMDYFLDLPFSGRILAQMKIYSKNPYNLSNDEINLMNFKIIEKFNDSVMLRKYFKIGALENVLKNPVTFRFNEKLLTIGLLFNEMDWGI